MLHWKHLVGQSNEELARHGIAAINLACAVDLPGCEQIDAPACFRRLDECSRYAAIFTERAMPEFHKNPSAYEDSEAYYRMLCLVTALQRDLGIRYNPDKKTDDVPLDTADTFIHGALLGPGGTCASLPVVFAAVGRSLGYPLKLVATKTPKWNHVFVRWKKGNGPQFNIEATATGLVSEPDDYYRNAPYRLTPEEERLGCFLKSMTPREELAGFLVQRSFRWLDHARHRPAVDALAWASSLAPTNAFTENTLKGRLNDWLHSLDALKPPGFPDVYIEYKRRRFPNSLPLEIERHILGLEVTENILKDPQHEGKWWGPMRRGAPVHPRPCEVSAVFDHANRCSVTFRLAPAS